MSGNKRRRKRSWFKKLKTILLSPFYSFVSSFSGVLDLLLGLIGISRDRHGSRPRKRRNRDFDRAGRERYSPSSVDPQSAANLRNATRVRDKEVVTAARKQHRMLAKNNAEAQQAKAELAEEKQSVSKGAVVSHLAKMSRRDNEQQVSDQQAVDTEDTSSSA